MCSLSDLVIDLKALPFGLSELEWSLSDDYFQSLEAAEVKRGKLEAHATIEKTTEKSAVLRLAISGELTLPCDRCLDDVQLPVESDTRLVVELGTQPEDDDERIVVSERDGLLDMAWIIYEQTMLALPLQRVHADGECNEEMLRAIADHSASPAASDGEPTTDPRWKALESIRE